MQLERLNRCCERKHNGQQTVTILFYHLVSSSGLILSRSHLSWCIKFTNLNGLFSKISLRNASPNTVFQKMEEFRRLTRWNGLSRNRKTTLYSAECCILPLVIIFHRSCSSVKETVFVYQEFCLFWTVQSTVFLLKITQS